MRLKIIPKIQSKIYPGEIIKSIFTKENITGFEADFQKLINVKYCKATYSGRAALIAILKSLGLKKGDEILLPGFTFQGLAHIIVSLGMKPVFADIDYSLNIDATKIEGLISKKTKALLLVHNLGNPNDMEKIAAICKKHNLYLIEDCAHTLGSKFKGKYLGNFSTASFYSFHYSKIINTYWGGMACTNNKNLAINITNCIKSYEKQSKKGLISRLLVSTIQSIVSFPFIYSFVFAPVNDIFTRIKGEDLIEYLYKLKPEELEEHKIQFTDFQSRIGIEQLKKLKGFNTKRKKLYKIFRNALDAKLRTQTVMNDSEFVPMMLVVFAKNRKEVIAELKKKKIEAKDFYINFLPGVKEYSKFKNNCANAKNIADEIIYFPTFHWQTENDIVYIAQALNKICRN